jgi:hypothetical protein
MQLFCIRLNNPNSQEKIAKYMPILKSLTKEEDLIDIGIGILDDSVDAHFAIYLPNHVDRIQMKAFHKIITT